METVKDRFDTGKSIMWKTVSICLKMYGNRENNEKDVDSHKHEKPKMLSQSQNYIWSEKETRIIGSESPKIIGGTCPGWIMLVERILYVPAKINTKKSIGRHI